MKEREFMADIQLKIYTTACTFDIRDRIQEVLENELSVYNAKPTLVSVTEVREVVNENS